MLDGFIRIPGPDFLVYFMVLEVVLCLAAWWVTRMDPSWAVPPPALERMDADTLAMLAGGDAGVVRASLFRLWRGNRLAIAGGAAAPVAGEALTGLDQALLEGVNGVLPTRPEELDRLAWTVRSHLAPIRERLVAARLLFDPVERRRRGLLAAWTALPLWGIGGSKFLLGLWHHRPVVLLALLMILGQLALIGIIRGMGERTALGRKFLRQGRARLSWLRKPQPSWEREGTDPALGVALFGWAFLTAFPGAHETFEPLRPKTAMSSTDGSGGSSDGGDSGGDGGG
ncbi:MAG: TIGR04222 domain-containing membrane protein, partial [Magnetococcales bacterium]|nr:TIGR04222 domain-containing membrane protein [Magnetococcales bacterium]